MSVQNILQHIDKEADASIAKLNEARDKAIYEIQKEYDKRREARSNEISTRLNDNIDRVKQRANTFAKMESRNHLLTLKREILTEVFDRTVKHLAATGDYTKILTALLKRAGKAFKTGTVVPAKDKEAETKKAISDAGVDFELAARAADIKGGFILKSDDVEVDFSFESILEKELWGDLETELSNLLFG